eukprot:jgi/Pico_ML_1/54368/g4727.t1
MAIANHTAFDEDGILDGDVHEEAKTKGEGGVETVRPSHESNSRRKKKKKKRKEVNAARNQAETNPEEADGEASRTGEAAHRYLEALQGLQQGEDSCLWVDLNNCGIQDKKMVEVRAVERDLQW